jgi:O-acetyl-ADP-ribose deacetylase (regulator of RNase III)
LRGSTAHALRIAAERGLRSIAFPAVGTGIAGFPIPECANIMLREAVEHLKTNTSLEKIYFVLFDAQALSEFEKVRAEMGSGGELHGASGAGSK